MEKEKEAAMLALPEKARRCFSSPPLLAPLCLSTATDPAALLLNSFVLDRDLQKVCLVI